MSDSRPPYHRRNTKPIPRADLAPVSKPPPVYDKDAETKFECPCCKGSGAITAEQRIVVLKTHPRTP